MASCNDWPSLPQFVQLRHQNHTVLYGNAEQCDKTDRCRYAEINPGCQQNQNTTDHCERHVHDDQHCILNRHESPEQQHKDQSQTDRHDDRQALHRPLLIFELSAPDNMVTGRQIHLRRYFLLSLCDKATLIAVDQITFDRNSAHIVFPADPGSALIDFNRGQLRQRNALTFRRLHRQIFQARHRITAFSS